MTKCQFPLTLFWSNCVSNSFLTCCLGYGCNQPLHPEFYVATFWNEVDKEIWAHHERMHSGVPWLQSRLSSLLHTFSLLEVVPHGTKMGYASTFATPTQTQTQVLATSRCTRIGQNESKIRHRPQWALFFALAATIPLRANADGNMFTTSLFQNVWFWGPFLRNAKRHFNKKPRDEWSGS